VTKRPKSLLSILQSVLSFSSLNIFVSSTNFKTLLLIPSSKSYTNIKSRGPNTEPCGTPLLTVIQLDPLPLIYTLRLLLCNQFLSHPIAYLQCHAFLIFPAIFGAVPYQKLLPGLEKQYQCLSHRQDCLILCLRIAVSSLVLNCPFRTHVANL